MNIFGESYKMRIQDPRMLIKAGKELNCVSQYNLDTNARAFKPSGGMLKAIARLFFDGINGDVGLGKTGDTFYSITKLHDSDKEKMICSYNSISGVLSMGIKDSTKAVRPYDESRFAYEILIPMLLKQAYDDTNIKTAWEIVANEVETDKEIRNSRSTAMILDKLYYYGKQEFDIDYNDIEDLRILPEIDENLSNYITQNTFTFKPKKSDNKKKPVKNRKTALEIINELRQEAEPYVKGYYSTLSDEDKSCVPTENDVAFYLPTDEFIDICHLVLDGIKNKKLYCSNILFWGPPGTGKSSFAIPLAYIFQLPWRFEQGFGSKDVGDYQGTTIAKDGKLETSTNTAFVNSIVRGGVFVDDDFNYQKEAENTFKNSVLVPPYTAKLADQTEVKRSPFSIYISTANPHCEGSRPITSAFKNRHFIDMQWKSLPDDKLIEYVAAESGYDDIPVIRKMVECYKSINQMIGSELDKEVEANHLTPRNLVYWATQTRVLKDPIKAANYNLLGALGADVDESFIETVKTTVLAPRFAVY